MSTHARRGPHSRPVRAAALLLPALLAACAALPVERPAGEGPARYLLAPAQPPPGSGARADGPVLEVMRVRAAPGFEGDAMRYVRRPRRLEAYARGRWADAPARMLQPAVVDTLAAASLFRAVVAGPSPARAALRLDLRLLALYHDLAAEPPGVRLVLRAALVERRSRRVLATRRIEASAPAPADGAGAAADGAARALDAALAELVRFCREALAAQAASAGATWRRASRTTPGSEGLRGAVSAR